ncbi:MAG: hypothetical protein E7Z90_05245 [Cyanobacteria bacterium SIG29]|nr:hypothetical protein [Cyanobacteria bacterium SIG29]
MKKILTLILIILFSLNYSYAVEEIHLEKEKNTFDFIADVYYGKVENINPAIKLFTRKGLQFENSYINSVKATFFYDGQLNFLIPENGSISTKHDFSVIEPMINTKFNENKSEFEFSYNIVREVDGHPNGFTRRISNLYFLHKLNENQSILLGQGDRVPTNYNGSISTWRQEFVLRSMLGRTFGDARSVGIRNLANYKYVEYDIGLYDSTRYMKDFGRGLDFTGYVMFKPLANFEDKIGTLKLGSSYNYGEYNTSYSQYSFFLGYDYNKVHFKSEYANADGYNTKVTFNDKADGFYTTLGYDITPKLTIIGRYDYMNPNKKIYNDNQQEFTAGIIYKMFKNMKFFINYVHRDFENKPDSNMILFATRFII